MRLFGKEGEGLAWSLLTLLSGTGTRDREVEIPSCDSWETSGRDPGATAPDSCGSIKFHLMVVASVILVIFGVLRVSLRRFSASPRDLSEGTWCLMGMHSSYPLFRLWLIYIDRGTYTSVHVGGLIWGIIISLTIFLLTIANQQTIVSLVATFYINRLYRLGLVPPRADPQLLSHPSPNPWAPSVKIRRLLICTLQGNREWGWDGAAFASISWCFLHETLGRE